MMDEVAERIFCGRCKTYHYGLSSLDDEGFPVVEWTEPHRTAREVAVEALVARSAEVFASAVADGREDDAESALGKSLGFLIDGEGGHGTS